MAETTAIENKLSSLQQRHNKLSEQLEAVEVDINACQRVLKMLNPALKKANGSLDVSSDELRGMDLDAALLYIANRHNGEINTYQVRPPQCLESFENTLGKMRGASSEVSGI